MTAELLLAILSGSALVVITGLSVLYWTTMWQIKEYRFDRMRDFLSTRSGRRAILSIPHGLSLVVLGIALLVPAGIITTAVQTALLIAIATILVLFRSRPVFTTKAILISTAGGILTLLSGYVITLYGSVATAGAMSALLAPLYTTVLTVILMPVTARQKQRIIRQARERLQQVQPTVIGITGSYGKSTTKEFLKTILEQRFTTLATPKNINSDIGVAQTVLTQLTDEHEVFVVEMGAYRPGEIDAICDLVQPIVGILTAIDAQHLSLFGTLETIMHTKGELMRSLPSSGLAITNSDSSACLQVADQSEARKRFFSTEGVAQVYASEIRAEQGMVHATLHIGTDKAPMRAPLHGVQVIPSILGAAAAASHLGMTIEEITSGIAALRPQVGTMHLEHGLSNMYIIDDSYNSSPASFRAAVDYLALFTERRRIVCTPGMDELGPISEQEHEAIGTYCASVADLLVITRRDFAPALVRGAIAGGMTQQQIILDDTPASLIERLGATLETNDILLIEGRVHPQIQQFLTGRNTQ